MNKVQYFLLCMLVSTFSFGQELNCEVVVNAEQTGRANVAVFRTLQNSLSEFINQTKWTGKDVQSHQQIQCSMFINITEYEGDSFSGTIQVQSSRPVYGSTMISPVFNYNDEQFQFSYTEYEPLDYNPNQFNSNLVAVISYYVMTILGLDADTFEEEGGTRFFQEANQIVNTAQQGGNAGWKSTDGNRSRYRLNADLLSNAFLAYRKTLYTYHRQGLDVMHEQPREGKQKIASALLSLHSMNNRRPNSLLVRTFFDAKADEIQQVFSGGPQVETREVVDALNRMAPTFSQKWGVLR